MNREELEEALAKQGEDYDRVTSRLADAIQDLADIRAAEAWSTPDDMTKAAQRLGLPGLWAVVVLEGKYLL